MKFFTPTLGALVLSVALLPDALASEKVDKQLEVASDSIIQIENVSGQVKIVGWDKNQVSVVGELGDRTESFRFERDGKSVVIDVEVKKNRGGWWGSDSDSGDDLVIRVPHSSRVDYHSPNSELKIDDVFGGSDIDMINGQLNATNLQGRIRLKTVNGDVRSHQFSGDVSLDTVNGDIRATEMKGEDISINTVNGDIRADSNAKEVRVETVNGDIELFLEDVSDIQSNTVNGSIEIDMTLIDGGTVRASSVGGSIELDFQQDIAAKFSIEAHAGGSIKNRITDQKANKAKYGPRRWLEFSTGNPTAKVDVSTVNGRIELSNNN